MKTNKRQRMKSEDTKKIKKAIDVLNLIAKGISEKKPIKCLKWHQRLYAKIMSNVIMILALPFIIYFVVKGLFDKRK